MKSIPFASFLLVLLLTAGCSNTGTKIQSDKLSTITRGVTTEQDIIAAFGKPNSVTTTDDRKILVYNYREDNSTSRTVVATTGSIVGGMVAGSIGSLAGSLAGSSAVAAEVSQEILTVDIDKKTGLVNNYQFQQTQ